MHAEQDNENSREPPCHLALKWEGSKKRSTITVLTAAESKATIKKLGKKKKGGGGRGEVGIPRDYEVGDSGDFVPVLAMDCRGVEPYAFHAMGDEFVAMSEGGATFDSDVDLSEADWADYDEENDISVSISDFEAKFISA